jgi:hypothetical protein
LKEAGVNCEKMPPKRWRGDYPRRYNRLRDMVLRIGGGWGYKKGSVRDRFVITVEGMTLEVVIMEDEPNMLDRFFVCDVKNPKSWDDISDDAELRPDAFFMLMGAIHELGKPTGEVLRGKEESEDEGKDLRSSKG